MLICGEKINSSSPEVAQAIYGRDEGFIVKLIQVQASCGADFLDINTALAGGDEAENMLWVAGLIEKHSDCGLMLDSPDPHVLEACLCHVTSKKVMINSISKGKRYHHLLTQIAKTNSGIICMPMVDGHVPKTPECRLEAVIDIVKELHSAGIADERIYIDPLVCALAADSLASKTTIDTLLLFKESLPRIKTICGLSNISAGLPCRPEMNAAFLAMLLTAGLDGAILDITSESVRKGILASEALLGNDENCLTYVRRTR